MKKIKALLLALAIALAPYAAYAQGIQTSVVVKCIPTEATKQVLTNAPHNEQVILQGVTSGGNLMEVYSDQEGDDWTLTITLPEHGMTCWFEEGHGLEVLAPEYGTLN